MRDSPSAAEQHGGGGDDDDDDNDDDALLKLRRLLLVVVRLPLPLPPSPSPLLPLPPVVLPLRGWNKRAAVLEVDLVQHPPLPVFVLVAPPPLPSERNAAAWLPIFEFSCPSTLFARSGGNGSSTWLRFFTTVGQVGVPLPAFADIAVDVELVFFFFCAMIRKWCDGNVNQISKKNKLNSFQTLFFLQRPYDAMRANPHALLTRDPSSLRSRTLW